MMNAYALVYLKESNGVYSHQGSLYNSEDYVKISESNLINKDVYLVLIPSDITQANFSISVTSAGYYKEDEFDISKKTVIIWLTAASWVIVFLIGSLIYLIIKKNNSRNERNLEGRTNQSNTWRGNENNQINVVTLASQSQPNPQSRGEQLYQTSTLF